MVLLAERVAKHFDYVRVDFLSFGDEIAFSELTFVPANCLLWFEPREFMDLPSPR
jgi:hypothetical protein